MRIAHLGLGILLVIPAGVLHAQSAEGQANADPLAAAAKRARESKQDASKPARVWDNDTIPKSGQTISVVGQSGDAAADGTATATDGANPVAAAGAAGNAVTAPGAAHSENTGADVQGRLSSAKEKLASLRTDLDLMQRTLVLDSQMYYGKPDYSNDRAGAQKLADEQAAIASKQQAIDEQEKEIAALESLPKGAPQDSQNNDGAKNN
ncbi:MAG TPA: hypothetical protein VGD60_12315 [Candidatus Acidoferrales bacterium]